MNKKNTIIYLVLFLLGALVLSACGQSAEDIEDAVNEVVEDAGQEVQEAVEAVEEAAEEVMEEVEEEMEEMMEEVDGSIWVLLPDSASSARWETDDRRFFEAAFEAAGVDYNIVNAEGDAATQQTQAEQAITGLIPRVS